MRSEVRRGSKPNARVRLLDAAIEVVRQKGLTATSVDDLCVAAGVTKGAFFHHFESKEGLAVAAVERWSETTGALFATAAYHDLPEPLARIMGYLDLRASLISDDASEFSCLAGTMVQEAFRTSPAIRAACCESIFGHAATLEDDFAAAIALYGPPAEVTAASLARHTQTVLQGAFILSKASNEPAIALESIEHLRRYVRFLFSSTNSGKENDYE